MKLCRDENNRVKLDHILYRYKLAGTKSLVFVKWSIPNDWYDGQDTHSSLYDVWDL